MAICMANIIDPRDAQYFRAKYSDDQTGSHRPSSFRTDHELYTMPAAPTFILGLVRWLASLGR